MWKALLLLVCVTDFTVLISCDDATNPVEDIEHGDTESTVSAGGASTEQTRTRNCGCHPPICPKNEVYYNCSGGCIPQRCSEIGFPLNCNKKCTPGCVCKGSYVRADNGTCIPIPDCPSCGGDLNAEQGCGNNCGRTCSDYNKPPKPCPPGCIFNGCNCRKGFVYDNNVKSCVKPEDCTPICRANEEYSPCINGGCVARNCSQIGKTVPCVKLNPKSCIKGCVCVTGYLRASNGTCVPKDLCTPKCDKPNEVYDVCPAPCPPKRCNVDERVIDCAPPPKPGDPACEPGCRCADNYYRNATGTCVLKKNCEKPLCCDGANEIYVACPPICPPQQCGINPAVILCMRNPEYGDPACRPSCICRDGYVRNDAKKCIPKDKCPKCDGLNEYWDTCIQGCSNQTCDSINQTYFCPYQKGCKSGCRCSPGFYRNASNVCVPEDECPKTCGKNEHWETCFYSCGAINQSCEDIGKRYNCPAQQKCHSGCRCNKGYWRNKDNVCIPECECPPTCGLNEVYSNCTNGGCDHRNCSQIGKPQICIDRTTESCTKGCICVSGYLRANNGTCIPQDQCPATGCGGDPNAQPGCGYNCGKTCTTYKIKKPNCPRISCKPNGCDCKDGYVFDDNVGKCVLPQECITCGINEEYDVCPAPCPPRRCDVDDRLIRCAAPPKPGDPQCKPGCRCRDNYARNATGTCVLREQCEQPLACNQPNEIYDSCPAPCPGQSCDVNPALVLCAPSPQYGDAACRPACRCIDGYVRNRANNCVPRDQCRYPPICEKNEEYYNCTGGCIPRKCSEIGFPLNCDKKCTPGCVCKGSYVRADNGTCIPIPDCPSCGGDKNAQQGCGSNCGRTCSDYKNPPTRCPIGCIFNGCNCRKGFVYDKNVKACVKPEDCTPICQANEEYSSCTNGGCDARNCSQVDKPVPCVKLDPRFCIKGCVCVEGYLRASNGTCVPKDQCTPTCDKPNEVYDVCPAPCPPKWCNVNEAVIKCAAPPKPGDPDCKPGCRCADTYYRNATGTCVPKKKCEKPLICDRPNEVYNACPPICPTRECGVNPAVLRCMRPPEYGDPSCRPSCVCRDGYVRNADKECIPKDQCPQNCPANEEYSTCINGGCDARNCSQVGKPVPCVKLDPKSCIKGCVCVEGWLRDSNGICIPKDKCPTCDQPNEVYDVCPAPCPPKWCNINEAVIKCAAPPKPGDPDCKPGCRCADTYYRNATGTCVPKKKCEKPLICDRPNEVYNACPPICPTRECGVNPAVLRCMRPPEYGDPSCRPSCVCRDGYVRNADKECIPKDQCPKPCGQYEYWEKCIVGCTNQPCADLNRPAMSCPAEIVGQCKSGCRCKPKHYRNSKGVCVPESECPRCDGLNESWEECIKGCSNQSCDDIGQIFHCPNQPAGQCKSGCRCNPGTWRNASKVCVPREECPKPDCPSGEIWSWCPTIECDGDYCPKTRDSPQSCPVGIVCDKPRCVCENNRKRDWKTGKCISIKDCPKFKCNCNEEYQVCPSPCPGENCSDYINGPPRCPPYKPVCRPQCRCIKGYYRDADGTCIPSCQCPNETPITTTTEPPTTNEPSTGGRGTGLTGILDGITVFTGTCLYNRMQSAPSENVIMSAMSVFTPIAELCLWSEGAAYDQCIKILNLKDKQDIRDTFPKFAASYEGQTSVNFSTAAKIYCDEKHKLSNGFKDDTVTVFNAGSQELDFSKNKEAADIINAWVESKTNNRIKDLVTPDMLSALTRLVLVNAIYFKGQWLYEFNKNNTKDEEFYLNDGTTKQTKMMYQEIKDLDYGEIPSLDCQAVQKFYKGKTSSMIIVLPNTKNGTMDLANKLQDPANWKKITDSFSPQKVQLHIPQFKITTTTDLKDLLKKANMTDWFNCQNSGLKGLLEIPEDVCITDAIQKAFIEVNEEGAEAAAANAVVVTTRSLPFPPPVVKQFKANRAFLYYLRVGSIVALCGAFNG